MTDVDTEHDEPTRSPRRRRVTVGLAVVFMLSLAGFWAWIWVYQLTNQGERDMPDRLDDLAWTADAEQICLATTQRIDDLPGAHTASTADERADVIVASTDEIGIMLDELATIAPTGSGRDATITAAWLADYREFLGDRYRYAETLRSDPAARFLVTEKYGSHITAPIDRFARVNEMEGCMSPGDV
ncbi:MAG: hypothetical protein ACXIVQ_15325 [Acidimicrobiales bacterium]